MLQSVTVFLFHKLKLLQNTPGVKTFLKSRTETSPIEIQCVETLLPFKIPIWRLFHWDMLAIWLLSCMANLERIINILKNMPSCFFMSLRLRIRVLGKIQTRIFESKHRFCVFLVKSQNGSWIHKIHTLGGFFSSNLNQDFWGRIWKKSFWRVVFWTMVTPFFHYLYIIPFFVIFFVSS